jgi:ATP-dependent exoDNAse (exonuclease V) alpha subunit
LPWVEQRIGLALAESLVAAIRLALISKVLVMTGGPGVGKTAIVRGILRILAAKGTNLLLCAPTGRAAKRMTEATGFEAKTIHRLLEVDPRSGGFKRGDDNPLDCDPLVVDETSMVDIMLMQALMKAVPDKAALLIVGDIDHYPMLQRNLLYTGVTRGKRLVVLVGQKKAIAIAVRNVSGRRRWSKLDERLAPQTAASADLRRVGR